MKDFPEGPKGAARRVRRKIQAEGLQVAYECLVDVARDPKAQSSARATAGVALLRAGGLFEKADDTDDSALDHMSLQELQTYRAELEAIQKALREVPAEEIGEDEDDIFG